jgi:hypothetical protein
LNITVFYCRCDITGFTAYVSHWDITVFTASASQCGI